MEKVILCACPKCYVQVEREGFCSSCSEDCAPTRDYGLSWWRIQVLNIASFLRNLICGR